MNNIKKKKVQERPRKNMLYIYKSLNDDVVLEKTFLRGIMGSNDELQARLVEKVLENSNDTDYRRALQIVRDCKLYLAQPISFNDPFDCIVSTLDTSKEDILEVLKKSDPTITRITEKLLIDNLKRLLDIVRSTIGVCCMTPYNKNILMWSHYADHHRGICFGFDKTKDRYFFGDCLKVEYVDDLINVNIIKEKKLKEKLIQRKHSGWEYEHEYRIVSCTAGLYSFNPRALTEIIFGFNVDEELRDGFIKVLRENRKLDHVKLYVSKMSPRSYKLIINPFKG